MKIVHTEASCGWGGQEIRILSEAAGLIARGHDIQLLCPSHARIFAEARQRGIPVTALPIEKKRPAGFLALRHWLKKNPIDIVNTHSSTDSWLAALACATLKTPPAIVRTRHISAPISNNLATRWMFCSATQHIATTGEKLRQTMILDNRYPARQITSVPTGIDTTYFVPGDREKRRLLLGIAPSTPSGLVIGIIATLRSWKGHRYLIEAFSRLPPSPHFAGARLLIVGDGPQKQALQAQVESLGLGDRVIMPGNQSDVLPWLQALDIFVLPSYANEGVPQALMQAMACAIPCITTDVGSIGELARHQETALVVPPEDVAALTDSLTRLGNDAALRTALGKAARAHCAVHFDRERMLDEMEKIFSATMQTARSKRGE